MKVKELIALLEQMPEDAEIAILDQMDGWCSEKLSVDQDLFTGRENMEDGYYVWIST